MLEHLLYFEQVGKVVCGRPNSAKPHETKNAEVTILQLIASGIVELKIVSLNEAKKCIIVTLVLMDDNVTPFYLTNSAWICWTNLIT